MKHILFFILLFISAPAIGQTLYTTGVTFCAGVPVHNPGTTGAKWALDTTTWNLYVRSYGTTWTLIGNNWIQNISGCAAPAYTPTKHQSKVVINACDPPELYIWDGAAWDQIGAGSGGLTGTGLATRIAAWTASGALGYDVNMVLDTVNNRMGVNTASPTTTLDVDGTISIFGGHTLAFKDTSSIVSLVTLKGQRFIHTRGENSITESSLFIGYEAGRSAPATTGSVFRRNIAIGNRAGEDLVSGGEFNLFLGNAAGANITTGDNNIGIGSNALLNPTTSGGNVAIGVGVMQSSATGANNTSVGYQSTTAATFSGTQNAALGVSSLAAATSADNNTSIGQATLQTLTTGDQNVAVGRGSGATITTGAQNVFIGTSSARLSATGASRNVFIGYASGESENGNDKLYIENTNGTTPLIGGDFSSNFIGVNTLITGIDAALEVTGTGATSATMGFDVSNSNDSIIIAARNDRRVGINTETPDVSLDAGDNTDGIKLPSGTTAQEPAVNNTLRFNSDRESLDARENGVMFRLTSSKTPSIAAGAAAGTGPTIAVAGNDLSMKVTLTTGTSATTGALFTVTYASSMDAGVTNYPVFSCADADCTGLNLYVSAESNTAFTISTQNAPTDGVQYIINIHIGQ